jgi:hypothetical protein
MESANTMRMRATRRLTLRDPVSLKQRSMPFSMDDKSLAANKRIDEVHAHRVADLERVNSELHAALRDLAASTLQLLKMSPPRKPADAVIVGELIKRARRVLANLGPPKH